MIKDAYDKLKKKYPSLPEFDEINNEFEIESIEKEYFLLRNVRRAIADKFEGLLSNLSHILQPENISICEFYEFRCFDTDQKTKLFTFFKQLRCNYLRLLKLDILLDDAKDVEAISEVFKFWKKFKLVLVPYFDDLEQCWAKEYDKEEILGYLG